MRHALGIAIPDICAATRCNRGGFFTGVLLVLAIATVADPGSWRRGCQLKKMIPRSPAKDYQAKIRFDKFVFYGAYQA